MLPSSEGTLTQRGDPHVRALSRGGGRVLAAIGLSEDEERAYVALLTLPACTLPPLAHLLGYSRERTRTLLEALEVEGLVTHSADPVPRYMPTAPEVAVAALIDRRREELAHTQEALADLAQFSRYCAGDRAPFAHERQAVEIVTGPVATSLCYQQILREAQREIINMERGSHPYVSPREDAQARGTALARGVACRTIYDHGVLQTPRQVDRIRGFVTVGEEARVFEQAPVRLLAADHRVGLVPLDAARPNGDAVLIRSSPLLEVLHGLFDALWERATPISFTASGRITRRDATADTDPLETDRLVALLTAGLKDATIARQLDISSRTLDRRVAALMHDLGASTRFQAGWLARNAELGQAAGSHKRIDE